MDLKRLLEDLKEVQSLLDSGYRDDADELLSAVILWVELYRRGDEAVQAVNNLRDVLEEKA